jgi:hypothetical protein
MIDFKKLVSFAVVGTSFFVVAGITVEYISNTVTGVIIGVLSWFALLLFGYHFLEGWLRKYRQRHYRLTSIKDSFDFEVNLKGEKYLGKVNPSLDVDKGGFPLYFKIELGKTFFGFVKCQNGMWRMADGKNTQQEELIQAIGRFIRTHYEANG